MPLFSISEKQILERIERRESFFLYVYAPICGTCAVAKKMLDIALEIEKEVHVYSCDLNYAPTIALEYTVQSVPALLHFQDGQLKNTIFAFRSIEYVLKALRSEQVN